MLTQQETAMLNPPWSQPFCETCYEKRVGVPCHPKVRAKFLRNHPEKCADCGTDTHDGIYFNPTDERWTDKQMELWKLANWGHL